MLVKEWMSSPVITVAPDALGVDALRLMVENQIRRLVVVDEFGAVLGMITERDLRGLAYRNLWNDVEGIEGEPTVAHLMARNVVSVTPDTNVKEAALLMHNHKVGGLPVMDGSVAVGMITVQDLMEILIAALDHSLEKTES